MYEVGHNTITLPYYDKDGNKMFVPHGENTREQDQVLKQYTESILKFGVVQGQLDILDGLAFRSVRSAPWPGPEIVGFGCLAWPDQLPNPFKKAGGEAPTFLYWFLNHSGSLKNPAAKDSRPRPGCRCSPPKIYPTRS